MRLTVLGIRKDFFQNPKWPTANAVCEHCQGLLIDTCTCYTAEERRAVI